MSNRKHDQSQTFTDPSTGDAATPDPAPVSNGTPETTAKRQRKPGVRTDNPELIAMNRVEAILANLAHENGRESVVVVMAWVGRQHGLRVTDLVPETPAT